MRIEVTRFRMRPEGSSGRASVRLVDANITLHGVTCTYDHAGRFHVRFASRWVFILTKQIEKPCATFDTPEAQAAFTEALRLALPDLRPPVRETFPTLPADTSSTTVSVTITRTHHHHVHS